MHRASSEVSTPAASSSAFWRSRPRVSGSSFWLWPLQAMACPRALAHHGLQRAPAGGHCRSCLRHPLFAWCGNQYAQGRKKQLGYAQVSSWQVLSPHPSQSRLSPTGFAALSTSFLVAFNTATPRAPCCTIPTFPCFRECRLPWRRVRASGSTS